MKSAASVPLGDGHQALAGGLLRRAAARAIDSAVIGASLFVAFWFGFFSVPVGDLIIGTMRTDPETLTRSPFHWALFAVAIAICVAVLLYEPAMTAMWGQTFGKAFAGIEVVSHADGIEPLWGQAFVRWFVPTATGAVVDMAALLISGHPPVGRVRPRPERSRARSRLVMDADSCNLALGLQQKGLAR